MRKGKFMMRTMLALVVGAHAGLACATAQVEMVCGDGSPLMRYSSSGATPTLRVTYSTAGDAGKPGLFWLGVLSADQQIGAALTPQGWQAYQGGLYPYQSRHDAGLRHTITLNVPMPGTSLTTAEYVGYGLYLGHGVYTQQAQQQVASRRAALNRVKPDMVAKGRWRPDFDTDDTFIWTLIQKDMTDNGKYGRVYTIPYLDCTPPQSGGGS